MLIETLVYEGALPRAWGRMHGETFRQRIQTLYAFRLQLTLERTDFGDEATTLAIAELHLPVLADFDRGLYEELLGIAEGAGLTPAQLVLLNHYTDLRDLSRDTLKDGPDADGGCSVLYAPTDDDGPLLAQTWDMHGSATDFVVMLQVPGGPGGQGNGSSLFFTITGCVGMCGMTSWGTAMTINNLNSLDAQVGVVWPALVRRSLQEPTAKGALDVVMQAPLGSGHHYLVADGTDAFGVETSGTKKKLTQTGGDRVHLHTNHCQDDEMAETCRILDISTTRERLKKLQAQTQDGPPKSASAAWRDLADVSMKRNTTGDNPHAVATCGAMLMDLNRREAWVTRGSLDPDETAPMKVRLS